MEGKIMALGNKQTNLSPKRLLIYSSDPNRIGIIGDLKWNGEIWEINGIGLDVIRDIIDNGMVYNGTTYGRSDHELYLPLTRAKYSSISFEQVS